MTGLVLKDDDESIELPSYYTKRKLYTRWCWDRGWDVRSKGGNGSHGQVKGYDIRVNKPDSFDHILWPIGSVRLHVCAMATFLFF